MFNAIWLKFLKIGAAILAPLLMAWALYASGKSKAKQEALEETYNRDLREAWRTVEEVNEANAKEAKTIQEANNVQSDNSKHSDAVIVDRLRDQWSRD